ncbi:MAG: right-handed parallel beta-helix repeat-containing protein, partial [Candidatus Eisenbacteria bacterium]|nr:right-handed parallel beta-helix repeat-containing protein [Candidatus Eisenbacteria bacterium]
FCVIDCQGSAGAPHRGFILDSASDGSYIRGLTIKNGYVTGTNSGGAIAATMSYTHFENCIFWNNRAEYDGGAVFMDDYSAMEFSGCLFAGNENLDQNDGRGGVICAVNLSWVSLNECLFSGNSGYGGACLYLHTSDTWMNQCTINGTSRDVSVLVDVSGTAFLEHTIISFGDHQPVYWRTGGNADMECCDFFGNGGGDWVGGLAPYLGQWGNICADPLYCGSVVPFGLHENSPCAPEQSACGLIGRFPVSCGPMVYSVEAGGGGDYATIQAAIDAAVWGGIVELGDGTYTGDGNRDLDFYGKRLTVRSASDNPNACIIDCEGSYGSSHRGFQFQMYEDSTSVIRGVTISNGYTLSAGGAIRCTGGANPTLANCILSNNHADQMGGAIAGDQFSGVWASDCRLVGNSSMMGGALLCQNWPTTYTNCTFQGNTAIMAGAAVLAFGQTTFLNCEFSSNTCGGGSGGAVYVESEDAYPTFTGCEFLSNVCSYGGGLRVGLDASAALTNCEFRDNRATGEAESGGGGLYGDTGAEILLTDCTFTGNEATMGGGIFISGESTYLTLDRCTLENNSALTGNARGGAIYAEDADATTFMCFLTGNAAEYGGGVCAWDQSYFDFGITTMSHNTAVYGGACYLRQFPGNFNTCVFNDNQASQAGGAFYCNYASPDISQCLFQFNTAPSGGGLFGNNCHLYMLRCTFEGNDADAGGAMTFWESMPLISACTLVGNTATAGGGLACYEYATPVIDNTIIASNFSGGAIYCANSMAVPSMACCDLYGNIGGDWVGAIADFLGMDDNISEDPLFCGQQNPEEPYTLHQTSPCTEWNNQVCGQIGAWPEGCSGSSTVENPTDQEPGILRGGHLLSPGQPSPFRSSTTLTYQVPGSGGREPVSLSIYDAGGRLVRRLVDTEQSAGIHSVAWDGRNLAGARVTSGVYFCRLDLLGRSETRPLILLE